ncbi:MAG: AI-2E family transporter [Candidatus Berkelbacteria bacterium]|nr:AI-2E family transporter [Candidatus Berkelbacteria bacterium]MCR4307905.1 AI-2E family transporter [Candidatus Berkelbacteria bacterium]
MTKIDITNSTLVRLILILLGVWFVYYIRDVFVLLFLVLIIVAGLSPTVDRWAKYITRPGAVISVFLLLFVALAAIFSLLVPPLVHQTQEFTLNLPSYTETLSRQGDGFLPQFSDLIAKNLNQLSGSLSNLGQLLFSKTVGVISGVVAVITVLVLTFYLLLEEEGLKKIYRGLLPAGQYEALSETTRKIASKLGAWLRGQIFLMFVVGVFTTIGLFIVGSPYALTLGLWSGLTEVIPILGPWIGAIPGVAVGLVDSPLQGFLTLLVYVVVQQLEGNVLVPRIMSKAVGLNPFIVILAILIGGKLYGLMGVLLSVPMAAAISVIAEDWPLIRDTFSSKQKS